MLQEIAWFVLACLLEQAEFELRFGLQATLRPTMASQADLCAATRETRRLSRGRRDCRFYRRESKPTPLLVPVPGQLFHEAVQGDPTHGRHTPRPLASSWVALRFRILQTPMLAPWGQGRGRAQ
jgi:hypothetical protein